MCAVSHTRRGGGEDRHLVRAVLRTVGGDRDLMRAASFTGGGGSTCGISRGTYIIVVAEGGGVFQKC